MLITAGVQTTHINPFYVKKQNKFYMNIVGYALLVLFKVLQNKSCLVLVLSLITTINHQLVVAEETSLVLLTNKLTISIDLMKI